MIIRTINDTEKSMEHLWIFVTILCCASVGRVLSVAPTIDNLAGSTSFSEDTTTEIQIFTLTITDTDSAASVIYCSLGAGSTAGANTVFRVRPDGGTVWYVYTVAGTTYSYTTQPSYSLEIICEDETGATGQGDLAISLLPNSAPVITNLPGGTVASVATSAAIGHTVFTITYTDAESDQVALTMSSCTPASCPFAVYASGHIQLTQDISETTIASYVMTITPSDHKNSGTTETLTVSVTGINNAPTMNTIADINVAENLGLGISQIVPTCTDTDGDTLNYFLACSPSSALTYFEINTADGTISTSATSNINYELLVSGGSTSFSCSMTCSDGKKTDQETFTINVYNVNEAPSFEQNGYSVSVDEGNGGTQIQATGFNILDPDSGDTATFSQNCGAYDTYFTIDSTTGIASFAGPYDYDAGTRPTSVTCTVTVTDAAGLSESQSLEIEIRNINDNSPIFTETSYFWHVGYAAATSTTAGTVTANDADAGTFGVVTYSLDQSSLTPSNTYFGVSQTGEVYVASSLLPLTEGSTINMNVIATDGGGTATTAAIQVVLVGTTTTSTTTTTDRYRTYFEDPRNVTIFCFCMLVLLGIILFGGFLFTKWLYINFCAQHCCKIRRRKWKHWAESHVLEEDPPPPSPEPIRPSPPPTPPPQPEKPRPQGDPFGFWSVYT